MNKEELKILIQLVREFDGYLTLYYIPTSVLNSTEKLYRLYYGGPRKIEIGKYYIHRALPVEITDNNIDKIVNTIYKLLSDNIMTYMEQALDNMDMDDIYLKYFDREEEKENYKAFKAEVLRLKKENKK